MVANAQHHADEKPGRLVIVALVLCAAMVGGCSQRTMVEQDVSAAQRAEPIARADPEARQSVGAPDPVLTDDPSKRRGPQGQPAPYGRDTITGKALTDLLGQPGAGDQRSGSPAGATNGTRIVVGKGETLSTIARRHKVSVDSLRMANDLRADRINAGQTLIIPGG